MAASATPGAAGYVVSDYYNLEDAYTVRRKYDLGDKVVELDRTLAPLDWRFRQMGKKKIVTDPEPKGFEREEVPQKFTLAADGADTDYEGDTIQITDAQAKWMQEGDVFAIPQLWCDSDGANYSTTKYDQPAQETVVVKSVSLSGGALGAGYAKVLVARGNGLNQAAAAAGTVNTVLSEYTLLWQGNNLADGGLAPNARDHEPQSVQNYLQFFSETVAEDSVYKETNLYAKESFESRMMRKRKVFNTKIEKAYFFGRQAKDYVGGKPRRRTGGIVEFIPTATTALDGESRRFNFASTFDMTLWRKFTEIGFRYGNGSARKWGFVGRKFYTELYNYLQKSLIFNDSISKAVGIKVVELDTGHGILELMTHPMFTEMSTSSQEYAVDMIAIDPTFFEIMVMKNHDVQVRDINPGRSHTMEREIFNMTGLWRNHASAHFLVHGITESV